MCGSVHETSESGDEGDEVETIEEIEMDVDDISEDNDSENQLINFIDQLGILDDMNHDRNECSRFTRRLQRDIGKICSCVNN